LALEKISPFIPPANVEKIKLTNPLAGVVITDSGGFGGAGLRNNTGTTIFIISKGIFGDKEIRVPIASNRRAVLGDGTVVEIGGQRFIFHRDEGRLLPVETGGQAQDLIKEVINNLTLNTGRQSQVTQKVVIGRAEDSDYVLGIFGTSRKHLELRVEEGQLIAEDLNSTYGTYVNGKRITNPTILHSGDKIVVGDLDNHLPISEFIVTEIGVINSQGEIVIEKNY
jgi:hypothetical protein